MLTFIGLAVITALLGCSDKLRSEIPSIILVMRLFTLFIGVLLMADLAEIFFYDPPFDHVDTVIFSAFVIAAGVDVCGAVFKRIATALL